MWQPDLRVHWPLRAITRHWRFGLRYQLADVGGKYFALPRSRSSNAAQWHSGHEISIVF